VEMDSEVRLKVVELIVDLAETSTLHHFFQLLDVLKKVASVFLFNFFLKTETFVNLFFSRKMSGYNLYILFPENTLKLA